MKKNMGTTDRVIRILVAILFSVLYFAGVIQGTTGVILLILSVVFLVTGILASCPLYLPLKIDTRKKELRK